MAFGSVWGEASQRTKVIAPSTPSYVEMQKVYIFCICKYLKIYAILIIGDCAVGADLP